MKDLLLTLCAMISVSLCATAQTPDEIEIQTADVQLQMITAGEPVQDTKQEIKEREKRLREHNDDIDYAKASNSLSRGYFVLLADDIQIGNAGYREYNLRHNSNFILVQDCDGIIQFALNGANPAFNGLGGWTGKGTVKNKTIQNRDNGDVYLQYDLVGPRVNVKVHITLFHGGKRAVATINGGPSMTIRGEILPYRDKEHK